MKNFNLMWQKRASFREKEKKKQDLRSAMRLSICATRTRWKLSQAQFKPDFPLKRCRCHGDINCTVCPASTTSG